MTQDPNLNSNDPYGQPQPSPQQPAAQPAYGQTYAAPTPQAQDPGQVFGIIALIGAFVFFPVGIILGVIARKKSREAGLPDNALGKWGFILGIIFGVLWVLYIILMVVFVVIAASSGASAGYSSDMGFLLGAL